jgi:hypothetical protein
VGDDSDWVREFGGETGAGLGRFVEPLDAIRDRLEGFIVCVVGKERESRGAD